MAYVDRDRSRETAVSGIAATMLVGGIGFVLVAGLAMNVVRTDDRPVTIHNWALPTPPPPPPPPEIRQPRTTRVVRADTPVFVPTIVPTLTQDTTIELPKVGTTIAESGTTTTVTPPPQPPAVDRASEAAPRGNPADWVTTDDYPPSALRAGQQGTTGFRLDIGVDGRATGCTIVASSGSDALDQTACRMLMRRARFTAARDAGGASIAGSYTSRIVWRVPAD